MADPSPAPSFSAALPARSANLRFGRFELQTDEQRLLVDGQPAPLRARTLTLLLALAQRAGSLVTRQELLELVWPGLVVEENNLSVQINALRKVLGSEIVVTIPGRGYRFKPPVSVHPARLTSVQRPATPRATHIPPGLPLLISREVELVQLGHQLDGHALVSIVGAGGIGKTRLAQALLLARMQGFEHGACFVELAPVTQATAVPAAVAAALGMRLLDHENPFAALAQTLASLQVLIALDNAEHVLEAVAATAQALLQGAPGVRLMVTSQVPLKLSMERVFRLGPLAVPAAATSPAEALRFGAVALFVARVQALDHRFVLSEAQVEPVVQLCRQLDGAALAIELAAARLPQLGLTKLLALLAQRLQLLNLGKRDAPQRQRTLRAALEWSCSLLGPTEEFVFRALSVFVGGASLDVIQMVLHDVGPLGPDPWDALDALGDLVDRSLVQLVLADADADAKADDEPRYRLLDSPLALARERLAQSGEAIMAQLRGRHAQAMRARFEKAYEEMLAGHIRFDTFTTRLEADVGNGQAALHWALAEDPVLALALAPLLAVAMGRPRYAEVVPLWAVVEPLMDRADSGLQPALLARAAWWCAEHWQQTRVAHARMRAEQAHAIALAAGLRQTSYGSLRVIAAAGWRMGDRPAIEAAVHAMRRLEQADWSPFLRSLGACAESWLAYQDDDHDGAIRCFNAQAELCRAAGVSEFSALNNVVGVNLVCGRSAEAIRLATQLVERLSGERNQHQLALAFSNLSAALLSEDRAAEARLVAIRCWPLMRQFDLHPQWADDAALITALEGSPQACLRLAGFADAAFVALGQPREQVDQIRIDRAERLARAALGESHDLAACERLKAEGAATRLDDLPRLAFGA